MQTAICKEGGHTWFKRFGLDFGVGGVLACVTCGRSKIELELETYKAENAQLIQTIAEMRRELDCLKAEKDRGGKAELSFLAT